MVETANTNDEPYPVRIRVGRDSYGKFYVQDPRWDHSRAPVYVRADWHEAEMEKQVRRELALRRENAALLAQSGRAYPEFCHGDNPPCLGKGYCPRDPSCAE